MSTEKPPEGATLGVVRLQFRPDAMHEASLSQIPEEVPFVDATTHGCNSEEAAQRTVDLLHSEGIAPCVVVMEDKQCHAGVFYNPNVYSDEDADREMWNIWEIQSLH